MQLDNSVTPARGSWRAALGFLRKARTSLEVVLPCMLVMGMIGVVTAAVIARYVFNAPIASAYELATLLCMWAVFLGAAGAMGRRLHISVDVFIDKLPPRMRALVDVCVGSALLVVLFWIAWIGYEFVLQSRSRQFQTLGIPYAHMNLAVPVGCFLIALHVLEQLAAKLKALLSREM